MHSIAFPSSDLCGDIAIEAKHSRLQSEERRLDCSRNLIVGGYGLVGRRIATVLVPGYPECFVIGGGNMARAQKVATEMVTACADGAAISEPSSINAQLG